MTTKRLLSALIVAIILSAAHSAPLTEGNFLVLRRDDYSAAVPVFTRVYIDEIIMGGSVVQTWDPDCVLLGANAGSIVFDQRYGSAAFACYKNGGGDLQQTADRLVVAIQPNGTLDITTFSAESVSYGEPLCAFVEGRDAWLGYSGFDGLAYAKRNGEVVAASAVTFANNQLLNIQKRDGVFYVGGFGADPYFIATTDNSVIPRSTGNSVSSLFASDVLSSLVGEGLVPHGFYVVSETIIYATTNGSVIKFYKSNDQWNFYFQYGYVYNGGLGITADPVQDGLGYRYLWLTSENKVVFMQDYLNTAFASYVTIKTYPPTTLASGVAQIKSVPTCADAAKNQDETDTDCGGYACAACPNAKNCLVNEDCASKYCNPTMKCSVPTCSDTFQNQNETDADCGGNCSPCVDGKKCLINEDCESNYCNPDGLCSTPTCTDGFANQDETDIDCGGETCEARCEDSFICSVDSDCLSTFCALNTFCATISCFDGFKNGNETGVDCGGEVCGWLYGQQCDVGQGCVVQYDCRDLNCQNFVCAEPDCANGIMDGLETDVDCGGEVCPRCGLGQQCTLVYLNCEIDLWCPFGICIQSNCSDAAKNQRETDVDCGGPNCSACSNGKTCTENTDCISELCESDVCVAVPPVPPVSSIPQRETPIPGAVSSGSRISALLGLFTFVSLL